jgi:threonine dehydratase
VDGRDFGLDAVRLTLKLELFQHSGSFKAHGAFANVLGRTVPEPGGAAALAALLPGRYRPGPDERVGVLVSGGNTTAVDFAR